MVACRAHPGDLNSRGRHLAAAHRSGGRLDEAIDVYETTLASNRRVLGDDHPQTLTSANNLATAYANAGRLDEAIDLYEATLTICRRVLDDDHPTTTLVRDNLESARPQH